MKRTWIRAIRITTLTPLCLAMLSCASENPSSPYDPYEGFNRDMYAINKPLDKYALRPVANIYNTITPPPIKTGVSNFFHNLYTPITVFNDVLQGKPVFAITDTLRFVVNTIAGIGGLFDVAKHMRMPYHYEDFGMTLAYWQGTNKPTYLMLPLFGPSTFTDAFGKPFNTLSNPFYYKFNTWMNLSLYTGNMVQTRAKYLQADDLIDHSFDPYAFIRSAYIQHRIKTLKDNHESYGEFLRQHEGETTSDKIDFSKTDQTKAQAEKPEKFDDSLLNEFN